MNFRNRIIGLEHVPACDLIAHPNNWRLHSERQKSALSGLLSEVGFVDAVVARRTRQGLQLIDGHCRAEVAGNEKVPVLVVDLSDDEAAKVLALLDPLAAMADVDAAALDSLLKSIESDDAAVAELLSQLAAEPVLEFAEPPESVQDNLEHIEQVKQQRRKGNKNTESKNDTEKYLVIVCGSRAEREALCKSLGLPADERYVPSSSVSVRAKGLQRPIAENKPRPKAASAKKSGAGG